MARTLDQFTISREGDAYTLHIEAEGETMDFSATYEQLDLISEVIEDRLNEDEDDALEVEETE